MYGVDWTTTTMRRQRALVHAYDLNEFVNFSYATRSNVLLALVLRTQYFHVRTTYY